MGVGIRELKANLSEYLARAAGGEETVVTDRNRPVVRLVAYTAPSDVERGIDEGWIEAPHRTDWVTSNVHGRRDRPSRSSTRTRMTLHVDPSALLKRYVDEHDSGTADELMRTDPVLATCRLTEVEVRRNLVRLLTETRPCAGRSTRSTSAPRNAPGRRPRC
jgi:prevent-host-death family protein